MAENKGFSLKTFGMPWWLAGAIAVIVIAAAATGALSADLAGCFALMLAIGLICNKLVSEFRSGTATLEAVLF